MVSSSVSPRLSAAPSFTPLRRLQTSRKIKPPFFEGLRNEGVPDVIMCWKIFRAVPERDEKKSGEYFRRSISKTRLRWSCVLAGVRKIRKSRPPFIFERAGLEEIPFRRTETTFLKTFLILKGEPDKEKNWVGDEVEESYGPIMLEC